MRVVRRKGLAEVVEVRRVNVLQLFEVPEVPASAPADAAHYSPLKQAQLVP